MKNKLQTLLALTLFIGSLCAQTTQVQLVQVPPPPVVQSISATVTGNSGPATYCYWVIVTYTIGNSQLPYPGCTNSGPGTLTGSRYVTVSWSAMPGAVSYDVVVTNSQTFPSNGTCTNCLVASATTATSVVHNSAATNPYTLTNVTTSVTGFYGVNNRDYSTPHSFITPPLDSSSVIGGGGGGTPSKGTTGTVNTADGSGAWLATGCSTSTGNPFLCPNGFTSGTSSVAGAIFFYPPSDSTHYFSFSAPATRATALQLQIPTDPSNTTPLLSCATPASSTSTCSWVSALTNPATTEGDIIYYHSGSLTRLGVGTSGQILTSNGTDPGWSTGSGGSATAGTIDLPGSGYTASAPIGVWGGQVGLYGSGAIPYYPSIAFTTAGSIAETNFRLPFDFNPAGTVSVNMTTVDTDGNAGGVSYKVAIACVPTGSNAYNTEPTYGTALTLTGAQGANQTLEMTNTPLNIPVACAAGVIARVQVTRNSGVRTGSHGMLDLALKYVRQ